MEEFRLVGLKRFGLHIPDILLELNVQPFPDSHFGGLLVGSLIDLGSDFAVFPGDLFLRLAGDGSLNLFSRTRVISGRKEGFPIGVGLSVFCNGLLTNVGLSQNEAAPKHM